MITIVPYDGEPFMISEDDFVIIDRHDDGSVTVELPNGDTMQIRRVLVQ